MVKTRATKPPFAYYNENDPFAAAWLRELIKAGHIAPGDVDERSIEDVRPDELAGFTQCHWFAGIGVWSYALRQAGWPDDRPVWTGSCPCQPFSTAGKGVGFADERHLWPAWYWLIVQLRPAGIFGEQVASKRTDPWIDLVHADLEGLGYAFGCVPFPSAGVGAPHLRDRAFWVAYPSVSTQRAYNGESGQSFRQEEQTGGRGVSVGMAHSQREQRQRRGPGEAGSKPGEKQRTERLCDTGGMEHSKSNRRVQRRPESEGRGFTPGCPPGGMGHSSGQRCGEARTSIDRPSERPPGCGPTNGFWEDADWLYCRDGKWRPTCPIPQPLADGSAESLGRVCDQRIQQFEEEINGAATEAKSKPAEALRDLWGALIAEAPRIWAPGRLPRLHEAPFLLAFMRQLAEQGWPVAQCLPISRPEAPEGIVRGVRADKGTSCTSHQRGLERRAGGKHPDAVRVLSSVLARHTQEAWSANYQTYAESCFVLAKGAPARVGRLRGYGNAINAEAAKVFIESVMGAL